MAKIPEINQPFWGFPYFFKVFPSHPSIFAGDPFGVSIASRVPAHVFASPEVDGPKAGVPSEIPRKDGPTGELLCVFRSFPWPWGIPKMEGWFMMENPNLKWMMMNYGYPYDETETSI